MDYKDFSDYVDTTLDVMDVVRNKIRMRVAHKVALREGFSTDPENLEKLARNIEQPGDSEVQRVIDVALMLSESGIDNLV